MCNEPSSVTGPYKMLGKESSACVDSPLGDCDEQRCQHIPWTLICSGAIQIASAMSIICDCIDMQD